MIKTFYKGRLPHIQPIGATFFTTWHLFGAIPKPLIERIKREYEEAVFQLELLRPPPTNLEELVYEEQKCFFKKYDELLDKSDDDIAFLKVPNIAKILADQILRFDGLWYSTLAFCIMPNHCHWVADFSIQRQKITDGQAAMEANYTQLYTAMMRIKGASARYINLALGRQGQLWYHESYDHYVRSDREMRNTVAYTLNNAPKARLCSHWADWHGTYCRSDWREEMH